MSAREVFPSNVCLLEDGHGITEPLVAVRPESGDRTGERGRVRWKGELLGLTKILSGLVEGAGQQRDAGPLDERPGIPLDLRSAERVQPPAQPPRPTFVEL